MWWLGRGVPIWLWVVEVVVGRWLGCGGWVSGSHRGSWVVFGVVIYQSWP